MAQGHTDRATINQRKPVTDGMLETLIHYGAAEGWEVISPAVTQGEKSRIRALVDRGLLEIAGGKWRRVRITEDGRSLLAIQ